MDVHFDEVVADAMKLPLRHRVRLAQHLVSTLDDEIDADVESLWFAEAERRLEELSSAKVEGIGAEEALKRAGEALKE